MVNTSNRTNTNPDLQEVANRHDTATAVVDTLGGALDTIPLVSAEIARLRRRLDTTRKDFNNLLAAARATLSAHADGEEDPLYYLRDELHAQGQLRAEQHRQERHDGPPDAQPTPSASSRLARDGYQPMMVINSGSDLPETAVRVIFRAIWRYRSERTPIAVAAATFVAANALHHTHHAAWPWLALATLASVTALTVPPPAWARKAWAMLGHPARRAYAVAVTAAIGGWLSAATVTGPVTPPMPAAAVVFTIVCGIPWWANRRRRAKVRVDRMLAAWPEIANATGLPGSQIMSALVDVWGWRARLRLARGQTINDVITKIPALESGLGTFRVYPTSDDLANLCELRVLDIDPHADVTSWPGPSTNTITESIDLDPFEDAAPVYCPLGAMLDGSRT